MAHPLVVGTLAAGVLALLLLLSFPAAAQQGTTGLYWQCLPPSTSFPQGGYCPAGTTYPLPMSVGVNSFVPVSGTQRGVTISSSTGMTIPTGATVALVQAQGTNNASGQCLFWQDDGTAPTASAGQALPAYVQLWVKASSAFKMIAATGATCTATISYYK